MSQPVDPREYLTDYRRRLHQAYSDGLKLIDQMEKLVGVMEETLESFPKPTISVEAFGEGVPRADKKRARNVAGARKARILNLDVKGSVRTVTDALREAVEIQNGEFKAGDVLKYARNTFPELKIESLAVTRFLYQLRVPPGGGAPQIEISKPKKGIGHGHIYRRIK